MIIATIRKIKIFKHISVYNFIETQAKINQKQVK